MFPFAKIVTSEDAIGTRSKQGYLEMDSPHWATISSKNKGDGPIISLRTRQ